MKVRLSNNQDGSIRWADPGVDGLGKGAVTAFVSEDLVAADRRPLAPAAQPELQPIVVNHTNEHWQVHCRAGIISRHASQRVRAWRLWEGSSHPTASHKAPDLPLRPMQIDLFDAAEGMDPHQRYVADIIDLASHYLVAAAPLPTKSAHGVLWVVSG